MPAQSRINWSWLLPRGVRDPWFCLPVGVCMLLDAAVSLACQPADYWRDPSRVREGNSVWAALMGSGPVVFLGLFLVYCVILGALMLWLTGTLQKLLGTFVLLAHSYGAASWCHVEFPEKVYWWGLMAIFLAEAGAFAVYWRVSPACGKRTATAAGRAPATADPGVERDRGA